MNKDAEEYIARIAETDKHAAHLVRDAIEWAYEDAANVANYTICDTHIPTGVKIYGTRARDAILRRLD